MGAHHQEHSENSGSRRRLPRRPSQWRCRGQARPGPSPGSEFRCDWQCQRERRRRAQARSSYRDYPALKESSPLASPNPRPAVTAPEDWLQHELHAFTDLDQMATSGRTLCFSRVCAHCSRSPFCYGSVTPRASSMHVHLPKPLHGWREFLGEVAIIVLGVGIALGAEQIVEAAHWKNVVEAEGQALDEEVQGNQGALMVRVMMQPCIDRRLAELAKV